MSTPAVNGPMLVHQQLVATAGAERVFLGRQVDLVLGLDPAVGVGDERGAVQGAVVVQTVVAAADDDAVVLAMLRRPSTIPSVNVGRTSQ